MLYYCISDARSHKHQMPTNMIKIQGRTRKQPRSCACKTQNGITKIHCFIYSFNAIILSTFTSSKLMLSQRFTH